MKFRILFISYLCFLIHPCLSFSATQVGRYLQVSAKPLPAQSNLLQQTIEVKFPANVKTINDAIEHILSFSGYSLPPFKKMSKDAQAILNKPVPNIDRELGPMNLQNALLALVGKPYLLLVDPVHRLISFKLRDDYENIYHPDLNI